MLVSVIQKGRKAQLWVNLWSSEVKPQNLVTCLVQEVCFRISLHYYHHHLGKVFCPGCPSYRIYYPFSSGQTWTICLLKKKKANTNKYCWYIWNKRTRCFLVKTYLSKARVEEEIGSCRNFISLKRFLLSILVVEVSLKERVHLAVIKEWLLAQHGGSRQ